MEFLIVSLPQNDVVDVSMSATDAEMFMPILADRIMDFEGHVILIGEIHKAPCNFCCSGTNGADFNKYVKKAVSRKANTAIFVSNWHDLKQRLSKVIRKYSGGEKSNIAVIGLSAEIWIARIVSICGEIESCDDVEVQFPTWPSFKENNTD